MLSPRSQKLKKLRKIFSLNDFLHDSRTVGIVLLFCTAISLLISNLTSFGEDYHNLWNWEIPGFHYLHLPHTLIHFINDALMAVFFFMVGLEIKREIAIGELSSKSGIFFPTIAAFSGVALPAAIFLLFNKGTNAEPGWAIPSATDIAFSLGILAMVGKGIPYSFKVFLTALAIIDDLIAILIIAFFYGEQPVFLWLIGVALSILSIYLLIKYRRRSAATPLLAILLGGIMWYCMFQSGIHATFAGVLLAFLLPVNSIPRFEKILHTPVNFLIIPIFALANTSIMISGESSTDLVSPLSLGIILGLFVGKPLGIGLSAYLMIKSKTIEYPKEVKENWRQFLGLGVLAGIGFTMSIFVSTLAFNDIAQQNTSKLSVLIASILSMTIGFIWLKVTSRKKATL